MFNKFNGGPSRTDFKKKFQRFSKIDFRNILRNYLNQGIRLDRIFSKVLLYLFFSLRNNCEILSDQQALKDFKDRFLIFFYPKVSSIFFMKIIKLYKFKIFSFVFLDNGSMTFRSSIKNKRLQILWKTKKKDLKVFL